MPVSRRLALLAWTLAAMAACGDSSTGPRSEPIPGGARVSEIWIVGGTPAVRLERDTVEQYLSGMLAARGRTTTGDTVAVPVTWTSADTAVVRPVAASTPARTGTEGRAPGAVTVAARLGALRAEVTVVVVPPKVRQVAIRRAPVAAQPAAAVVEPDSVVISTAGAYAAECATAAGRPIPARPVAWSTSDTARATVDANGVLTGHTLGPVRLTAECRGELGETATAVAQLMVRPPRAARLAFTYAPDTLLVRMSDSVRAVLYDSAGVPSPVVPRVRVAQQAVTTDVGDRVTSPTPGRFELVASGDGLEARRALVVIPQPVARADVYPVALTLAAGARARLPAVAREIDGVAAEGVRASYVVDDPGVADVDALGIVTARAPGRTVVRVRADTASTAVPVEVVTGGQFALDVRLRPTTPLLTDLLTPALRTASEAWARVVLGDLPDLRVALPAGACDPAAAAEDVDVDDLVVFARVDSVDGPRGVLAYAGPCVIRGDGTAAVGLVVVDSADVGLASTNGILEAVLRHELGHVLGIGTLWTRPSLNFVVRTGSGFRYVGPRGSAVGRGWFGVRADEPGVALGDAARPGSGHWSESVLGAELMTPVANLGPNPLSLLTIEALGDLGYQVAATGADAFQGYGGPLTSRAPAAAAAAAAVGGIPFEDRLIVPRWQIAPGGRLRRLPGAAP